MSIGSRFRGRKNRRITSFSLPVVGGGIGWQTEAGDRDALRELFIFLEDRNILTIRPSTRANPDHVVESVAEVRRELVKTAQCLESRTARESVLRMRESCARYLHFEAASSPQGF